MSSNDTPTIDDLTDEQIFRLLERYHDVSRGNGALEAVASEIAGHGLAEIVDEVRELGENELGITGTYSTTAYRKLTTAVRNYGTRLAAELEASRLKGGEKVRIIATDETRLGAMDRNDETRFVGYVKGSVEGTFSSMHPNERLSGWALVDVPAERVELVDVTLEELGNPVSLVVPVHAANLERVQ